jgi:hypothetical protein
MHRQIKQFQEESKVLSEKAAKIRQDNKTKREEQIEYITSRPAKQDSSKKLPSNHQPVATQQKAESNNSLPVASTTTLNNLYNSNSSVKSRQDKSGTVAEP